MLPEKGVSSAVV